MICSLLLGRSEYGVEWKDATDNNVLLARGMEQILDSWDSFSTKWAGSTGRTQPITARCSLVTWSRILDSWRSFNIKRQEGKVEWNDATDNSASLAPWCTLRTE